jgi:GGDEF domain-containing protein
MDMVSIKKYLRPGKPKPEDYIRFLQLLLQGISLHAVDADQEELVRFRLEISTISERLDDQSSAEDILVAMGVVIRALAEYNRTSAKATNAHLRELQAMLAMMTETIAFLGTSSKLGIEQLQSVEKNLQKTSSIEDIRVLRSKLDDCLTLVRSESNRLRDESRARIVALQAGVERTSNHMRSVKGVQSVDSATGLHGRAGAEDLIAARISQGKEFVVTLYLVDRLVQVNGRFGRKIGDEVLLLVAQHVGQRLGTGSLFRWSGPALAAIQELSPSFNAVERQAKQIASTRLEKTIEADGRFTLLPVTCSFMLQKVTAGDSLETVTRNLDKFVATHAGENDPDSAAR